MPANYKNWVPLGMIYGFAATTAALGAAAFAADKLGGALPTKVRRRVATGLGLATAAAGAGAAWALSAHAAFSYEGSRKLAKQIVEGTAERVTLPEGGTCLDVGCGSGALAIAVAKRNPQAHVVGIDRWGAEYASFSKGLCESNAQAEGVTNVTFQQGDACHLDFPDETFDAVTSNYVYHNVTGANKQELLRETLRTLKKGGTFAIHDIMSPQRYGDMGAFCASLRTEGYHRVRLIPTDDGLFMGKVEGTLLGLTGSTLLVGTK